MPASNLANTPPSNRPTNPSNSPITVNIALKPTYFTTKPRPFPCLD